MNRGEKETRHAHVAQSVEHFLGKGEVTGSNPVAGSRAILSASNELNIINLEKWLVSYGKKQGFYSFSVH